MLVKTIRFLTFLSIASLLGGAAPLFAANGYYNEIFQPNGKVRPAYRDIYPVYDSLGRQAKEKFISDSKKDFQGDNALDPLPRVLTEDEYKTLKKGVEQRGKALQLFLKDYYSGNWSNIEKVIPKATLERIIKRAHESPYAGRVDPQTISFPYGPDIIRDAQGQWRVVEDNPGFIGGPGDLIRAREILFNRIPQYKERLSAADSPEQFYNSLVQRYQTLRNPPDGRVVLYLVPPYPDHEDDRLKKIFASRDVDVITPYTKKKLVINDRGVFVEQKGPKGTLLRQRVGYLVLNGEHAYFDGKDPVSKERALVEEAQYQLDDPDLNKSSRKSLQAALVDDPASGRINLPKLEAALQNSNLPNSIDDSRLQAKGLVAAILKGKVATNYSPGLDFIGDKEFYVYVDDLVRHYLHQEPIIKNIPTERFARISKTGEVRVDNELLDRVFSNPKDYVVKAVDGRGGNAVWVGPKIPKKDFLAVRKKILAEPERYIVQRFTHLSVLDGTITDLRMISAVDPKGVMVSPTPWGRALPIEGDGKVNLSSSGREVAVIVRKNRSDAVKARINALCEEKYLQQSLK